MTSELKPCPFCPDGGEVKAYSYECERDIYDPDTLGYVDTEYYTRWGCGCEVCGAIIAEKRTEAEAVEAWNTRAERTCRMIDNGVELCCSECDARHGYNDEPDYCMGCGAKVVV